MSRDEAGPISFLWLHRWAGASLKVWDTPSLGARQKPSSLPWAPLQGLGAEKVVCPASVIPSFNLLPAGPPRDAVPTSLLSGVAAFIFLRGKWVWLPPGLACYTLCDSGHSPMHIVVFPEILETCLTESPRSIKALESHIYWEPKWHTAQE